MPLDQYGVTVIDYQNNGSPGIFVTLSRNYQIPCIMLTDSDNQGKNHVKQVVDRGLPKDMVRELPIENCDLEKYLYRNGFDKEYKEILTYEDITLTNKPGDEGFDKEIVEMIQKDKLTHMHALIDKLKAKGVDKSRIPEFFKKAITDITREGYAK